MLCSIHRRANRAYRAGDARGGFIVDDADRLQLVVAILAQLGFHYLRIDAVPPVCLYDIHIQAQLDGHLDPQCGELPDFEH